MLKKSFFGFVIAVMVAALFIGFAFGQQDQQKPLSREAQQIVKTESKQPIKATQAHVKALAELYPNLQAPALKALESVVAKGGTVLLAMDIYVLTAEKALPRQKLT